MPDQPNWKELGQKAGQGPQKDVTQVYDDRYGRYQDRAEHEKGTKPPPETIPHPFAAK